MSVRIIQVRRSRNPRWQKQGGFTVGHSMNLFGLSARPRSRHTANRQVYISREAALAHQALSSRRVAELTLAVAAQLQSSSVRATQVELSIWFFLLPSAVACFRGLIVCGEPRVTA
jgi:hypothetical protein